jgi:putative ABC transport system permease protein
MESFWQDLKFSVRMLAKSPGVTAVAVVTLALGIGANTSLFSVVHAVLLGPLPFSESDRLAVLWGSMPQQGREQLQFSLPNFNDIRSQNQVFEGMTVVIPGPVSLSDGDEPEQLQSALVSSNFFDVFRVKPIIGRGFRPEEDEPDTPRIAVISHSLWKRRFNANPELVGKTISLDSQSYELIGVLPPDFRFLSFPKPAEVWIPLGLDHFRDRRYARAVHSVGVIAILKPGVTLAQAQAEMDVIASRLEQQFPENRGRRIRVVLLKDQVVKKVRLALWVLLGAVGFVLLIACTNVANLLLARAAARYREIAIRAALGAGRFRLARQLLTESVVLSLLGGAVGIILAFWGVDFLAALPYQTPDFSTVYTVPREQIGVSGAVLGYAFGLSLLTGLVFGLAPACAGARRDLQESLREGTPSAGRQDRTPGRNLLVVSEVALSMVLLVGAGLMGKSFLRLLDVGLGFQPENVLTVDLDLSRTRYARNEQVASFYDELLNRIQNLPGVQAAGAVEFLPLSGFDSSGFIRIEGRPPSAEDDRRAHYRSVTSDYFRALGIPLVKGRAFTDRDNREGPRVAIINETMARRYWPAEDPIGKRVALVFESLRFFPNRPPELDLAQGLREIVGVVADVKHLGLEAAPVPEMFTPFLQRPVRDLALVVRASSDPTNLIGGVRRAVLDLDKDQPISNISTMTDVLSRAVATPRFNALLIGLFAALALALGTVGLYGVIAYSVAQRTHEIGVRMALGAGEREILRLVLVRGLTLTLIGVAAGLAAALALTRLMANLLFGVKPTDPATFAGVALLLTAVALAACYVPARRATKVDPIIALRYE